LSARIRRSAGARSALVAVRQGAPCARHESSVARDRTDAVHPAPPEPPAEARLARREREWVQPRHRPGPPRLCRPRGEADREVDRPAEALSGDTTGSSYLHDDSDCATQRGWMETR